MEIRFYVECVLQCMKRDVHARRRVFEAPLYHNRIYIGELKLNTRTLSNLNRFSARMRNGVCV